MPYNPRRSDSSEGSDFEKWRVEEQQKLYPILRSLLSLPPLCPMKENQILMQEITSGQLNEASCRGKRKKTGRANSQKRQGSAKRKYSRCSVREDDSQSVPTCCSPDTTVKSPPKVDYSRPNSSLSQATAPMTLDQQSFLFDVITTQPIFRNQNLQDLAVEMNVPEQTIIQWVSDQYTLNPTPPVEPIVTEDSRHGQLEFYPMQAQSYNPVGQSFTPQFSYTEPQPKRTRYDAQFHYTGYSNMYQYSRNYPSTQYGTPNFPCGPNYPWYYTQNVSSQWVQYEAVEQSSYETISPPSSVQYDSAEQSGYQTISPPSSVQYDSAEQSGYQMISPPSSVQYESVDQSSYQIITPPSSVQSSTTSELQSDTTDNSVLWEDFCGSNRQVQQTPQYEAISPYVENPTFDFQSLDETSRMSSSDFATTDTTGSIGSEELAFNTETNVNVEVPAVQSDSVESDPERSVLEFLQFL